MKVKKAIEHFGEQFKDDIIEDMNVNPLRIAESLYFNQMLQSKKCYEDAAIEYCQKHRLDFSSTCNGSGHALNKFFTATCPSCNMKMESYYSGCGNTSNMTYTYRCIRCNSELSIGLRSDAIGVSFKKKSKVTDLSGMKQWAVNHGFRANYKVKDSYELKHLTGFTRRSDWQEFTVDEMKAYLKKLKIWREE
jgi:hypothetical protein